MSELSCRDERRRSLVREKGLNGLDFVEVGDPPVSLTVFFLEKAPPEVTTGNVRIDGGRRVRGIRVIDVTMCRVDDPDLDDCMLVTLDRFGDFSPYRLRLIEPGGGRFSRGPADGRDRPPLLLRRLLVHGGLPVQSRLPACR